MKEKKKFLKVVIPVLLLIVIAAALYQVYQYLAVNSMLVMADVMVYVKRCGPYLIPAAVILIAAIVCGIVFRRKLVGRRHFLYESQAIMAVLLALLIGVNGIALGPMQYLLNLVLASNDGIRQETSAKAEDLAMQIAEEGTVMLKNEDSFLPIDSSTKLNVFGWASTNAAYGGGGSGSIGGTECVTLLQGLEEAGFRLNDELFDFYVSYAEERPTRMSGMPENLVEPYADEYSETLLQDAKDFSDTAMIIITRSGQETADLPTDMGNVVANATAEATSNPGETQEYEYFEDGQHYLELSIPEREMVDLVCDNFDNVIVLYNGTNAFEMGWVDEYDSIKSVLLMPTPWQKGFEALGRILDGELNPSGRLTDTYVYDLTQTPSYHNFGNFLYENPEGYSFVNYVEGIYVGYKFYETAAAEGFIDYDQTVQYPFGYGLSYTDFSQEITDYQTDDGKITIDVTVKNTGSAAGKDVVELYYTAPYTNGGIEKSAVELLDFEKTDLLQPGESEKIVFTFREEDMASYDTGLEVEDGGYILEQGSYQISLRSDSHTVLDSAEYIVDADIIYTEDGQGARSTDLTAAVNQFTGNAEGDLTYLSRADHFSNYEEATAAPSSYTMPEKYQEVLVDNSNYEIEVDPDDEMPVTGAKKGLKLEDMIGLEWDDPKWDSLLDQMTADEMASLIEVGGWQTVAVDSVGKPATLDVDGPAAITSFFSSDLSGTAFPSEALLGATWNKEICYQMGELVAKEATDLGVSGWYAPAANLHRSAFGGRNFEYFSEDGVLSGYLASNIISGARENGVYCFMKHFVMNDQETNRIGKICTWCNEQAIRQTYLKPFEIAVKQGKTTAIMDSYNYIGTEWAGSSEALLTNILRGEWGFRGTALTDYFGGYGFMEADRGIRAGTDLMLTNSGAGDAELEDTTSATAVKAMRRASHNILYTIANSNAMYEGASHQTWIRTLVLIDVALGGVMAVIEAAILVRYRKKK